MTMINEPCLDCGAAVEAFWNNEEGCWSIRCTSCNQVLAHYWLAQTAEEAIDLWNNRLEVQLARKNK